MPVFIRCGDTAQHRNHHVYRTSRSGAVDDRPPLYEVIDPEALDALFRGETGGKVTFTYLDYEITATSDADITTRQLEKQPTGAD